ncbi:MAG: cytochrome b [Thermomonas sp.]
MKSTVSTRYSHIQRRLHWLMAFLVLAAYLLTERGILFQPGSTGCAVLRQGHFWVGLLLLALVWWRLASRGRLGVPPITPPLDHRTMLASIVMHVALYAFFLVMPILGLATMWSNGTAMLIPFTGIAVPALLPENQVLARTLEDLHGTIGKVFYWVIGLHVLASLWHHFFRCDDTLRRML